MNNNLSCPGSMGDENVEVQKQNLSHESGGLDWELYAAFTSGPVKPLEGSTEKKPGVIAPGKPVAQDSIVEVHPNSQDELSDGILNMSLGKHSRRKLDRKQKKPDCVVEHSFTPEEDFVKRYVKNASKYRDPDPVSKQERGKVDFNVKKAVAKVISGCSKDMAPLTKKQKQVLKKHLAEQERELNRIKEERTRTEKRGKKRNINLFEMQDVQIPSGSVFRVKVDTRYKPQAFFETGLDTDTRLFLQSLFDNVVKTLPKEFEMNVKFDFISNFQSSMVSLWDWITHCSGVVKDVLVFACTFVRGWVSDTLKALIDLVLGFFDPLYLPQSSSSKFAPAALAMLWEKHISRWVDIGDFRVLVKPFLETYVGAESLTSWVRPFMVFVVRLINYVFARCGSEYKIPVPYSANAAIQTYYERFIDLRDKHRKQIIADYDFAAQVFALQEDLEITLKEDKSITQRDCQSYLLMQLRELVKQCEDMSFANNGTRTETMGICIGGPTGTGKSTFTQPILLALMSRVLPLEHRAAFDKNHNELIFYRANENEFWDGYRRKHFAIVYDDFGQRRDSVGQPNPDAFEIIRLINSAPCHLHFSSIPDKAKNYAQPRLLFASTNRQNLNFQSIVSNKAVVRRFHHQYVQVPKLEYSRVDGDPNNVFLREMDLEAVRRDYPFDSDDPSTFFVAEAVEYIQWDFNTGLPVPGKSPLSFDELIDVLEASFRKAERKGDLQVKYQNYVKNKFARNCPGVLIPQSAETMNNGVSSIGISRSVRVERREKDEVQQQIATAASSGAAEELKVHSESDTEYHDFEGSDLCVEDISDNDVRKGLRPESLMESFLNTFDRIFAPLTDGIGSDVLMRLATVGGIFSAIGASLYLGHRLYSFVCGNAGPESTSTGKTSGKSTTVRQKSRTSDQRARSRITFEKMTKALPQSGDVHNLDVFYSLLKRSTYRVYVGDKYLGMTICARGTQFIMPKHFIEYILSEYEGCDKLSEEEEDELFKTRKVSFRGVYDDRIKCEWNAYNEDMVAFAVDDTIDIAFVYLNPVLIREHQDITKFFIELNEFKNLDKYQTVMPVIRGKNLTILTPTVTVGGSLRYDDNHQTYQSHLLEYNAPTQPGDCGSFILTNDPRFGMPKILGFHVAARSSFSITSCTLNTYCAGVAVYKSMARDLDLSFIGVPWVDIDAEDGYTYLTEEIRVEAQSAGADGFTVLRSEKGPRMPTETKIRPSPLHGHIAEIVTAPAALKPFSVDGVRIDPGEKARSKYSHDELLVPLDCMYDILPHIKELVLRSYKHRPWVPKVYTLEEALDGVPGVDFCNALDRTTSAGYPFNKDHPKVVGKKHFIGPVPHDKNAPGYAYFIERLNDMLDKAKKGIRSEVLYMDCLKDERRPIEKVLAGNTRQFMASPLDYTVLVKMYFGDFVRHVSDNRISNGCTIGIDPFSEWDQLVSYLSFSDEVKFTAGDYSKFDSKMRVVVMNMFLDIVETFYAGFATPEDVLVRRVLFQSITNSLHISNGVVYEFAGGNPSGNLLTPILNSVCNLIMIYTAAAYSLPEIPISDLFEKSRAVANGDDNLIAYLPDVAGGFSQSALERSIKDCFDMEYTVETKDGSSVEARTIWEVNYLKRGFKKIRGRICAPLDLSVILETLNWVKKSTDPGEFNLRITGVLVELSQHGKDVFDRYAPDIIREATTRCDYVPVISGFRDAFMSRSRINLSY